MIAFIALQTPDTDVAAMRAKYGGPASRFAETTDGLSVHYRDQGCRDCPAILLVHGSNASLHTFEPLVENLKDRFRLVSYDQPGHGLTGPHPRDDYSAEGMLEALDAVVDATGIEVLETIREELKTSGVEIYLSDVKGPVSDRLWKSGFDSDFLSDHVFLSADLALRHLGDGNTSHSPENGVAAPTQTSAFPGPGNSATEPASTLQ